MDPDDSSLETPSALGFQTPPSPGFPLTSLAAPPLHLPDPSPARPQRSDLGPFSVCSPTAISLSLLASDTNPVWMTPVLFLQSGPLPQLQSRVSNCLHDSKKHLRLTMSRPQIPISSGQVPPPYVFPSFQLLRPERDLRLILSPSCPSYPTSLLLGLPNHLEMGHFSPLHRQSPVLSVLQPSPIWILEIAPNRAP